MSDLTVTPVVAPAEGSSGAQANVEGQLLVLVLDINPNQVLKLGIGVHMAVSRGVSVFQALLRPQPQIHCQLAGKCTRTG